MIRITLTVEQEQALRLQARQEVGRVSERIHFVLLSHQGRSAPEIAATFGYTADTVRYWLKEYRRHGVKGLNDRSRSGRPPKERYLKAIVEAQMGQAPACFGYYAACWTMMLLVGHLARRFKVWVSTSTVRRAARAIGYRWRRPRLAPTRKADPEKVAKLTRILAVLKEKAANVHILFEDESDLQLLPVLRAMWMRGKQRRIATPGNNKKVACFGALDLTGAWHYLVSATKRSTDFIALLERVLLAYPTGLIILIVDNASIHTSKAVQKWLTRHPRLELLFLPKYIAADLNPVEKVWWQLKNVIAANRCFKDLVQLTEHVHRFFADFTPQAALRLVSAQGLVKQFEEALAA